MNKVFLIYLVLILSFISTGKNYSQTLSDNGIEGYTKLSDAIKNADKTTKLWITANEKEINLFTANFLAFKNLNSLKIKDATDEAGWGKLFETLSKSTHLKELELTFNEIKNIPPQIADLKNLEKLVVWGSPDLNYSELMKYLSKPGRLKTLELNSNGLTTIPNEIKLLKGLENFTITDNENVNYSYLVEELAGIPNLVNLSLEVNAITQLPANIIKLKNLKKLNISNNYISSLPDNMSDMSNLDSLQADGNLFVNYVDEFNKLKGINIRYISVDGGLSEEEKTELLKIFPKAKLDEKGDDEALANKLQNQSIEPIVPGLSIPITNYAINTTENSEINLPSGTQIKIPADAFVDENNQLIKGNVTLAYREFSNPYEIAFSGIPMTVNNGIVPVPLESAGMFELNASQNNRTIYIKKGKQIDVSLASNDSTDNYNLYKIDTASKSWVDQGKQGTIKIVKPVEQRYEPPRATLVSEKSYPPFEFSDAWKRYRTFLPENDSVLFKDRFYDTSYCHLTKYRYFKSGNYSRYVKVTRYKRENKLFKKAEKTEVWFNINNYLYSLSNTNPELRAFNGMTWVYDGEEKSKDFTANYIRKKRYSDVRIEKEGDSFLILLKESNGIITLKAHPITKFTGSMEKGLKTYDRRYRNYTKALARRERNFNKNLMYQKRNLYVNNKKIWKSLQSGMSNEEKLMSYEQWLQYYKNINNFYFNSISKSQATVNALNNTLSGYRRNISITQFGYYNCDRPLLKIISAPVNIIDALVRVGYKAITEPREYATINVAYTDKKNNKLIPKQVMMIDKRINSVAYLGKGTSMTVAINSAKNLFAVMSDGSVGLFSEDAFKQIGLTDKGDYTFSLKIYQPTELIELKRYLKY